MIRDEPVSPIAELLAGWFAFFGGDLALLSIRFGEKL
jgi:hypothetical protein